ncbi:ABC transporter ATP-binding protein [Taibaiella soli]|uniref:ABC transporter ATP-binding protein n=1 Tax=Taibaiella soli TaxID=1649169 RepID=A0A2W2AQS1_9BACT|nr:ABC transporter ATP-binding protein [Taibaiella soli]PZF74760.1 ABC transporter ATP-binding protein [Taibaiella soli]
MIKIENLTKRYGKFYALNDISAAFYKGQTVSLLGPNGSGKTTLIKSILGLVIAESGVIKVNGHDVKKDWAYKADIGYMPQIGRYPENMTIRQVIRMLKEMRKDVNSYDEELIERFSLRAIEHKTMKSLSGGTRQKVSACLAFLFRPNLLIMDEPTAGLDPVASEILKNKIALERDNGKLILITSHVISDLDEITSHVMYLQDGALVFYKTAEELRASTGEERLNKVIAAIMQNGYAYENHR